MGRTVTVRETCEYVGDGKGSDGRWDTLVFRDNGRDDATVPSIDKVMGKRLRRYTGGCEIWGE